MLGKFTHNNDAFICEGCASVVKPAQSGCRDHCPFCLQGKHVDINPGDRANPCQGVLEPRSYFLNPKKGIVLVFRCRRCGAEVRNKAAHEDEIQADDYDKILSIADGEKPFRGR